MGLGAIVLGLLGQAPAQADQIYDYSFGTGVIGTFTTGGASTTDPGYFYVTDLTISHLTTYNIIGVLDLTQFSAEGAYDAVAGAFINHAPFAGGPNLGQLTPGGLIDFGSPGSPNPVFTDLSIVTGSFAHTADFGSFAALVCPGGSCSAELLTVSGPFVITAEGGGADVPEPASLTMLGIGLMGMAAMRRRAGKG